MNDIQKNLTQIKARINLACAKAERDPNEIKLVLATKTVSSEKIKAALCSGETLIGENKVQEIKEKFDSLSAIPHEKHFIGHLQSNKIKDLLKYKVTCVQSIDRLELAEKLHKRLVAEQKTINVFVQINTSAERSKFGIKPENTQGFIREITKFDTLKITGLMTIGLFSAKAERVRTCFRLLKNIQQEINQQNISGIELRELSMGMSSDLEIAIEEGSTMIRVGTAIFGQRVYPDSYYWNENTNLILTQKNNAAPNTCD